jgi:hypothetical protein
MVKYCDVGKLVITFQEALENIMNIHVLNITIMQLCTAVLNIASILINEHNVGNLLDTGETVILWLPFMVDNGQ